MLIVGRTDTYVAGPHCVPVTLEEEEDDDEEEEEEEEGDPDPLRSHPTDPGSLALWGANSQCITSLSVTDDDDDDDDEGSSWSRRRPQRGRGKASISLSSTGFVSQRAGKDAPSSPLPCAFSFLCFSPRVLLSVGGDGGAGPSTSPARTQMLERRW